MLTRINRQIKKQKGFTLVELLLVVAILAVLAFLAVPAIASTIRNARIRTCAGNEQIIEEAIYRWYADQVAKGEIINFTTCTGYNATAQTLTIADMETSWNTAQDEADGTSTTVDDLEDYFTPTSRWPVCPFGEGNNYGAVITVGTGGGLEGVTVTCTANNPVHDRATR